MTHLRAFLAGFLSTLVFHQGVLAVMHGLKMTPRNPWIMTPTPPMGVPSVISLAFWGGLWGIALWMMIAGASGPRHWVLASSSARSCRRSSPSSSSSRSRACPWRGWKPDLIVGALILNGAWGLGVAFFMRLFGSLRR